jgi:hypothetical protein
VGTEESLFLLRSWMEMRQGPVGVSRRAMGASSGSGVPGRPWRLRQSPGGLFRCFLACGTVADEQHCLFQIELKRSTQLGTMVQCPLRCNSMCSMLRDV